MTPPPKLSYPAAWAVVAPDVSGIVTEDDTPVPTGAERARTAEAKAQTAEARAQRLAAKLRELGIDPNGDAE